MRRRVVFPEPRKPVKRVIGIGGIMRGFVLWIWKRREGQEAIW